MAPERTVHPVPSWFTIPAPEITLETVTVLLWLKLITPVPAPKAMVGAVIVLAAPLAPKRPTFKVPEEPFEAAMTMFAAAIVPPSATVRVFPVPSTPTKSVSLFVHVEPVPVTNTLLLLEVL